MFNSFVTLLQGFFSAAFWFGNFMPVAIVAVVHGLIGLWLTGRMDLLKGSTSADTWAVFLIIAALVGIAYVLGPLIPLFRGWLDGSLLPEWLHDSLRRDHVRRIDEERRALRLASDERKIRKDTERRLIERFISARAQGERTAAGADAAAISGVSHAIGGLEQSLRNGLLPELSAIEATASSLEDALVHNSAGLPVGHRDRDASSRLDQAQVDMDRVLRGASDEAEHRLGTLWSKYSASNIDEPQATRVGDVRLLTQDYSKKVYGVEFDYLWPRLQLVLPDKGAVIDRIVAARAQLDFAVLSLVLWCTVPLVWLPVLVVNASTPWGFLLLGTAAPLIVGFFYELVVQTQLAFGDVVRAVIDRYRLDVLTKLLRQPLPMSLAAERDLWKRVSGAESLGSLADFSYARTPAT